MRSHGRRSHRRVVSHKRKSSHGRRRQRGGGSCAAMPSNTASFGLIGGRRHSHRRRSHRQRGGMAPWSTGSALLLDGSARVQAEQGGLDSYIAELPSVIPKQGGGRRRSHRRRSHRRRSQRQRGGMSPYDAPGMLLSRDQYPHAGQNPQFVTEASVNPLYGEFRGAQVPR